MSNFFSSGIPRWGYLWEWFAPTRRSIFALTLFKIFNGINRKQTDFKLVLLLFWNSLHTTHPFIVCTQDSKNVGKMKKARERSQYLVTTLGEWRLFLLRAFWEIAWAPLRTVPEGDREAEMVIYQFLFPIGWGFEGLFHLFPGWTCLMSSKFPSEESPQMERWRHTGTWGQKLSACCEPLTSLTYGGQGDLGLGITIFIPP